MPKKKIAFIWDGFNVLKNWAKHKVRPFEAEEAFKDKSAIFIEDEFHSEVETRFILFGKTRQSRHLYIAFTMRSGRIRVISMRDANRKEVHIYEEKAKSTKI
jgi:uncharacterized protein